MAELSEKRSDQQYAELYDVTGSFVQFLDERPIPTSPLAVSLGEAPMPNKWIRHGDQ
jgi:hypothetical protein